MATLVFSHCNVVSIRDYENPDTHVRSQYMKITDAEGQGGEFNFTVGDIDPTGIPLGWPMKAELGIVGILFGGNRQSMRVNTFRYELLTPDAHLNPSNGRKRGGDTE